MKLAAPSSDSDYRPYHAPPPRCRTRMNIPVSCLRYRLIEDFSDELIPKHYGSNGANTVRIIIVWCLAHWDEVDQSIRADCYYAHERGLDTREMWSRSLGDPDAEGWRHNYKVDLSEADWQAAKRAARITFAPNDRRNMWKIGELLLSWALAHWVKVYPRLMAEREHLLAYPKPPDYP